MLEEKKIKTWSFSRLNIDCLYEYKLSYIEKLERATNGWALVGTHAHETIEKYLLQEIGIENVLQYFIEHYPKEATFPTFGKTNLGLKLYDQLEEFFSTFKGFTTQTIGVEQKFEIQLDEENQLIGFIDRVFRKPNGRIGVVDYKISNVFNGQEIIKKSKQLFVYAWAIKEIYGEYPEDMYFHFLKTNDFIRVNFNEEALQKTKDWVWERINIMSNETEFAPNLNNFYCANLCSQRYNCKYFNK